KMNIEMLEKGGCILVPGIAELLRKLRRRKIRAAIASSSTREYILAALAAHGLESWFDQVVSSEEVPRGKPRPDVFLRAAEVLGVRPEDCVIIEDSDNGLAAAREAGIRSIGFRNPNSGCQSLALADRIVDSVREIRMGMLASLAGGMRGG
ncbi:MAG TPA: HAD-IA family hydrolase, partial [Magnetospirillaceae bacterium]|nr:HAD-IA family hydrolase [Magnetospirillaceae bacterium]